MKMNMRPRDRMRATDISGDMKMKSEMDGLRVCSECDASIETQDDFVNHLHHSHGWEKLDAVSESLRQEDETEER